MLRTAGILRAIWRMPEGFTRGGLGLLRILCMSDRFPVDEANN